eukprot:3237263-Prymnesium_polylepis.1
MASHSLLSRGAQLVERVSERSQRLLVAHGKAMSGRYEPRAEDDSRSGGGSGGSGNGNGSGVS